MSECASKYNSRAEETIYILATLLERQTDEADEAFALVNDQQREIHNLETVTLQLDELEEENNALRTRVENLVASRERAQAKADAYFGELEVLDSNVSRLGGELDKANAFVAEVADMVADEDLLALKQAFGIDDSPSFIPEYLETEADYESAPVGTEVLYYDHEELDPRTPTYFYTHVYGGWENNDTGDVVGSDHMASYARKVLQWGSR